MKPTKRICDPQQIDDYLDDRLSDVDRDDFEDHLSDCDDCQREVQERAAEPAMWRDAVELLGGSSENSQAGLPPSADRRQPLLFSVLGVLSATDDPEMLGRLGEYEISGIVGVGGMGAVLKGFDKSLRRVVAIKVMAPHLAGSGSARSRFQREARAAAAITHHNVIDTYGVAEANGLPYLVMPYARGPSLQKRIDSSGPLNATEVARIGHQIAAGLAAAHEQGLVHRDIKPANILLNEGIERLWITDFGVAHAMDDASMTQTGVIAGTPQYMSPEQARGETVDHRSDLFSMGSVLYTACTGRPPFRSEAAYGILRRISDTEPRPIREINPEIPDWLCDIIQRLMTKQPGDRYQSASEVAELLEQCLAHLQQPTRVSLPATVGAGQSFGGDGLARPRSQQVKSHLSRFRNAGVWVVISSILLVGMGILGAQLTEPVDLSGHWFGEEWKSVQLSSVEEADGWYNGSFTDANGRRGTLQLEWSRLQRRYNGRWKMGDKESGSLTLRMKGGEVRGAATIDPDSPAATTTARLRDFSWRRTATTSPAEDSLDAFDDRASISIQTPVKGQIIRWGEGIRENARVHRGDLIAEIATNDPAAIDRMKVQQTAARHLIDAGKATVTTRQKALEAAKVNVGVQDSQRKAYELVKRQIAAVTRASIESAKKQIEVQLIDLDEAKAALAQAEAELERQQMLFEKKFVPETAIRKAEQDVAMARAKVEKAAANVESAENELAASQAEAKVKEAKAQVDAEYAMAQWKKGESELARAEQELENAKAQLAKAEKEVFELETQAARQSTLLIRATADGIVSNLFKGTVVKEGDRICTLRPQKMLSATADETMATDPNYARTGTDLFVQPQSDRERQAIIDVLSARLEAANARLTRVKQDLVRQKRLFEENIASEASVHAVEASLAEAEAEVKELNTKLEFYKTP